MIVRLNGEARELADGATAADLVRALGLVPETVAVEVNGRLVPRAERPARLLGEGDVVEIVTLVGGG